MARTRKRSRQSGQKQGLGHLFDTIRTQMEDRVRAMERDDRLLSDAQRVKGHAYLLSLELEQAVKHHAQWS